jgi:hypothetical protein
VEVLVVIVIAVLVLGVAIGPLLAMRNPAEADKLTPGGRPGRRVEQGAGRQRKLHQVANAQAHRGSAVANPVGDRNIPVAGSLSHLGPLIEDSPTTRSRAAPEPPVTRSIHLCTRWPSAPDTM